MHGSTSVRNVSRGGKGRVEGRRRDDRRNGIVCLTYLRDSFGLMYGSSFTDFGIPGDLTRLVMYVSLCIHEIRVDGNGSYD